MIKEMIIDASNLNHSQINSSLKQAKGLAYIKNCLGQRFIAAGMSACRVELDGIAGNALGAYLDGAELVARGNVQDAVGDTMNDGRIIIFGSCGDALGYSMRGGKIFVRGNAGFRAGIHLKEYKDKKPLIVIGGRAGSFLGEYLAGGVIIVLNLYDEPMGHEFTGMGMHGGSIIIRSNTCPRVLSPLIKVKRLDLKELEEIKEYVNEFCSLFDVKLESVLSNDFYCLNAINSNPFKQHYIPNY